MGCIFSRHDTRRIKVAEIADDPSTKPESDHGAEAVSPAPLSGARGQCRAEQTWQRDSKKPDLGNVKGKSPTIGRYVIDKCHGERDEMLGQVLAFPFHDRVKPALAEMTIPFLIVLPFDETNRDRRAMRGARKRGDRTN